MKRFLWLIVLAASTLIMPETLKASSEQVSAISGGYYFSCALVNAGVQCWGQNTTDYSGQLGDGTTTSRALPVQVVGLESGVTALSDSGFGTTCAVQNGAAKCWGNNRGGPLGDGTASPRVAPVQVVGLTSGVTAISVGSYHACAIVNGGVWCWGTNVLGALGNGTTTDSYVPVQVSGLTSGATAISTGDLHSCAIVNGGVQCWGSNDYGELGDGSTTRRLTPVPVTGLMSGVKRLVVDPSPSSP